VGIPFWILFATAGRSPQIGLVGLGEIAIGWFLLRGKLRKTAKKLKVTFSLWDSG
jgi:hypothetical protein